MFVKCTFWIRTLLLAAFFPQIAYSELLLTLDPIVLMHTLPHMPLLDGQEMGLDESLDELWMATHIQAYYDERHEHMIQDWHEKMRSIYEDGELTVYKSEGTSVPKTPECPRATKAQISAIKRHIKHYSNVFSMNRIKKLDLFIKAIRSLDSVIFRGEKESLVKDLLKLQEEYYQYYLLSHWADNNVNNCFTDNTAQLIWSILSNHVDFQRSINQLSALQQIPNEANNYIEHTKKLQLERGDTDLMRCWTIFCQPLIELLENSELIADMINERLGVIRLLQKLQAEEQVESNNILVASLRSLQAGDSTRSPVERSDEADVGANDEAWHSNSRTNLKGTFRKSRARMKRELSSKSDRSEDADSQKTL